MTLNPGEVIDELRRRLDPTTLALFERHIRDDRDAIGFALTADATILAPLDVERLAKALAAAHSLHEDLLATPTAEAIAIAREYAALTPAGPEERGEGLTYDRDISSAEQYLKDTGAREEGAKHVVALVARLRAATPAPETGAEERLADCEFALSLAEAAYERVSGAEERLRAALDELDSLRRDIDNAVAGLTEGQRRFFVRRVDAARAALHDSASSGTREEGT